MDSVDSFNPIKTTPSIGSNIYVTYDGRSNGKRALSFLPGVHMSLLGLGGGEDARFTLVWCIQLLASCATIWACSWAGTTCVPGCGV